MYGDVTMYQLTNQKLLLLEKLKGQFIIIKGPINQELFWNPPWIHRLAESSETLFLLRDNDSKGLPERGDRNE